MIARAECAELARAARSRSLGDGGWIRARQAPAGLGALDVLFAAESPGAVAQHCVEEAAVPPSRALSCPGRDGARELVHERLAAVAQRLRGQRQRQ